MSGAIRVYEAWGGPRDGESMELRDGAVAWVIIGQGVYYPVGKRLVWSDDHAKRKLSERRKR